MPIRILIVDDHSMVRSGLRLLLEEEGDFHVVGEAGDVDGGLAGAREHGPDVILLDLNMPGRPSLPAIPELLAACAARRGGGHDPARRPGVRAHGPAEAGRAASCSRRQPTPSSWRRCAPRLPARPISTRASVRGSPRCPLTKPGDDEELTVGSTFAGHRIDAVAGRGGMGVVYRATDITLDRPVALKLLTPSLARDRVFRARFERECRLAAALDHPHVVQIFHAGTERGALYLTMRYVDGTDLRALLAEEGRLEPARAVAIVAQVAEALTAAHGRGLVHRDVKPANVLISTRSGREHAFLTDFGITMDRVRGTDLTNTGFAVGTADYMSPEQARGSEVDGARRRLRARLRPLSRAHRERRLRQGQRRREDVGAHPRAAARPARRAAGAAAVAGRCRRARAGQAARRPPAVRRRARARGARRAQLVTSSAALSPSRSAAPKTTRLRVAM